MHEFNERSVAAMWGSIELGAAASFWWGSKNQEGAGMMGLGSRDSGSNENYEGQ